MSRLTRIVVTVFALISVLYSQIAIAAYACPAMQISQALQTVAAPAAGMDDMSGCSGMDPVKPVSCHDLGQDRNQSLDKAEWPQVSPFIAAAIARTVTPAEPRQPEGAAAPLDAARLARTTAPPLAIRHCCFRI